MDFVQVWLYADLLLLLCFVQNSEAKFSNYTFNLGTFLYTCEAKENNNASTYTNFTEAERLCNEANSQLAVVDTQVLFNETVKVFDKCGESYFWIGLNKIGGEFRWVNGSLFKPEQVGKNITTHGNNNDDCIALRRANIMEERDCATSLNFICFLKNEAQTTLTPTTTSSAVETTSTVIQTTNQTPKASTYYSHSTSIDIKTSTVGLTTNSSSIELWMIIVISVGGGLFLLFVIVGLCFCIRRRKAKKRDDSNENNRPVETNQPTEHLDTIENGQPVENDQPTENSQPEENDQPKENQPEDLQVENTYETMRLTQETQETSYDSVTTSQENATDEDEYSTVAQKDTEPGYVAMNSPTVDSEAYSTLFGGKQWSESHSDANEQVKEMYTTVNKPHQPLEEMYTTVNKPHKPLEEMYSSVDKN